MRGNAEFASTMGPGFRRESPKEELGSERDQFQADRITASFAGARELLSDLWVGWQVPWAHSGFATGSA